MYILKIKGTEKIPDFVQIRDKEMTLIAYFRLSQVEKGIQKNNLNDYKTTIIETLKKLPFGKVKRLDYEK